MGQFFNDLLAQIKGIWSRLEGPQRLVVAVVMVATIAGLGAIVWFASQPSYEVVYVAKSADDLGRAEQALTQDGVTFQPDGFRLSVQRVDKDRARTAIAKEGLAGVQTPSLDGSSMIEDAATREWKLNNAARMQTENAIREIAGVVSVTVTASKPRRLIAFRDRQKAQRASATVLLRLRSGTPWEQTAHAAAAIAASQLAIPKENVTSVNAITGQRWNYNPDRDAGGTSSEFRAMERSMSGDRTLLAQESLDRFYPGKTTVQVTVELDPSWEVRSEKVVPDEQLLKTEDFTKDSTDGAAVAEEAKGSKSKNEQRKREYITEIGERRVGKMAPEIRRMSVAVTYDPSLIDEVQGFTEDGLKNHVKASVGWDSERDNETDFSIMSAPHVPIATVAEQSSGPGIGAIVEQWGPTVGQILGVLVVVVFLRGLFKSGRRPVKKEPEAPIEVIEEELTPEEQQKRMRKEIERSIANDPAALAKMLESWLIEAK